MKNNKKTKQKLKKQNKTEREGKLTVGWHGIFNLILQYICYIKCRANINPDLNKL